MWKLFWVAILAIAFALVMPACGSTPVQPDDDFTRSYQRDSYQISRPARVLELRQVVDALLQYEEGVVKPLWEENRKVIMPFGEELKTVFHDAEMRCGVEKRAAGFISDSELEWCHKQIDQIGERACKFTDMVVAHRFRVRAAYTQWLFLSKPLMNILADEKADRDSKFGVTVEHDNRMADELRRLNNTIRCREEDESIVPLSRAPSWKHELKKFGVTYLERDYLLAYINDYWRSLNIQAVKMFMEVVSVRLGIAPNIAELNGILDRGLRDLQKK